MANTIFVVGLEGKTKTILIRKNKMATFTVKDLKRELLAKTGIDEENQRLIYGNKQLEVEQSGNQMKLVDYGISDNSTVMMVLRLPGGYAKH